MENEFRQRNKTNYVNEIESIIDDFRNSVTGIIPKELELLDEILEEFKKSYLHKVRELLLEEKTQKVKDNYQDYYGEYDLYFTLGFNVLKELSDYINVQMIYAFNEIKQCEELIEKNESSSRHHSGDGETLRDLKIDLAKTKEYRKFLCVIKKSLERNNSEKVDCHARE